MVADYGETLIGSTACPTRTHHRAAFVFAVRMGAVARRFLSVWAGSIVPQDGQPGISAAIVTARNSCKPE